MTANPTLRKVILELEGTRVPANIQKSVWHQFKDSRGIDIYFEGHEVLLSDHGPFPFLAPEGIPEELEEEFQGELRLGVFAMCSSHLHELLLVKKRSPLGDFWSIPGGLAERQDRMLYDTARREVREETGLMLSYLHTYPLFAYESVVTTGSGRRHNLMAVISARTMHTDVKVGDTKEIIEARWWKPAEFYSSCLKGEVKTLSDMKLFLKTWVEDRLKRHSKVTEVLADLKEKSKGLDGLLLDLIAVSQAGIGYHQEPLGPEALTACLLKEHERLF